MLRSLLRASAAVALAVFVAPAAPSAAPPPGLAYDEIVRVVVNATPPPPGNFAADVAAIQTAPAAPSAPPRRRGLGNIANIAGAVLSGGGANAVAGAVASEAISASIEGALEASMAAQFSGLAASARSFLQPHLLRYAYWNGWERVDDVAAQTATIRKCDLGQVVTLNLAQKTYTVSVPGSEPEASAPPAPRRGRAPDPQAPGTAVADLTETTRSLGPLRIENQPTTGYDATTSFTMSQATGSCRDGGASIRTVEYLSPLNRPAVTSCPIRRPLVPQTASEAVTMPTGGCRPTFTVRRSGPTPPGSKLSLYSLVTFAQAGSGAATPPPGGGFGFLTERGSLRTLGATDASLFEVPTGFTKSP